MRLRRLAAAAAGSLLVAATASGGSVAPAGLVRLGSGGSGGAGNLVTISPEATHAVLAALPTPPTTQVCEQRFHIACYQPGQLQQGFDLRRLYQQGITGHGQTIVVVDSFGSPTVQRDLRAFDKASHLPAPASLKVIQPAGKVSRYRPTSNREGWAGETDLDVEYAHAVAPGARIVLLETPTSENEGTTGFPQIVKAEKYVLSHGLGGVISQSFSATEQTFRSPHSLLSLRGAYTEAAGKGVTVLAAAGDSGAADLEFSMSAYYLQPVTSWPDSDPLVTGVGGIQLHLNAAGGNTARPTGWNDTDDAAATALIAGEPAPSPLAGGGGRSVIFTRPGFQGGVTNVVAGRRGVPDISMSAACNGAIDVYQSFGGQRAGWYPTCGTSEATPEFAGIVALANQMAGHRLGAINRYLYQLSAQRAPGIVDVVSGNNTVSFQQGGALHTVPGFTARPGYDLVSGVGTVDGYFFVRELAQAAGKSRTG